MNSFPVNEYEISLSRITGERQLLCDSEVDSRLITTVNTSVQLNDLQEFSIYTVTVTIVLPSYGINSTEEFSTPSTSMLNSRHVDIFITETSFFSSRCISRKCHRQYNI